MFSDSVAINGTLQYKSSFVEHIAMVQSNEDARMSVFDMSEMRVSQVIQPKASRMWMSFFSGSSRYNLYKAIILIK